MTHQDSHFTFFFSATYPVEKIAVKLHICNI